jgi:hypothetical protein
LVVVADRLVPWGPVLRVLKLCTMPPVRIVRVRMGLPGGPMRVVHIDAREVAIAAAGRLRLEDPPVIHAALGDPASGRRPFLRLLDTCLGPADPQGYGALRARVRELVRHPKVGDLPGRIEAPDDLPFGEVLRLREALVESGVRRIGFSGAPPPRWRPAR